MGIRAFLQRLFGRKRALGWEWDLDGSPPSTTSFRQTPSPKANHLFAAPPSLGTKDGPQAASVAQPVKEQVGILEDEPLVPAEAAAQVVLAVPTLAEDVATEGVLREVSTGAALSDGDAPKGKVVLSYADGTEFVLDATHVLLNDFIRAADRMMRPSGWGRRFAQKVGLGG